MLRSFHDKEPRVADSAYVDPQAVVIGDVVVKEDASVWPGAVIRGDESRITLAAAANVQDQVVIHSHPDSPARIGEEVTLGHGAVVHGCTIGKRSLVGINAVVLDEVQVGDHAVVAAGSVVTAGQDVPSGVMVTGAPATPHREIEPDNPIFDAGELYVDIARNHRDHSRVIS